MPVKEVENCIYSNHLNVTKQLAVTVAQMSNNQLLSVLGFGNSKPMLNRGQIHLWA
jgi:hypothetical protein